MGGQIKIGDRIFNAIGKGRLKQDDIATKQARWSNVASNIALTAIGNTATFAATVPFVPGTQLVNIKNIICIALFVDSSTGATYNVSEQVNLYLYPANFSNLDYVAGAAIPRFTYQSGGIDYQILANLGGSSNVAIDATIYGGDIVAKTLITPGVGDQVQFALSVLYEPL
jgi:hypothetical protein